MRTASVLDAILPQIMGFVLVCKVMQDHHLKGFGT